MSNRQNIRRRIGLKVQEPRQINKAMGLVVMYMSGSFVFGFLAVLPAA